MIPQAVVFDLDGTLIDSLPAIHEVVLEVCKSFGLPEPESSTVRGFVGGGVPVMATRLLKWAKAKPDAGLQDRVVAALLEAYETVPLSRNVVFPEVQPMLNTLWEQGLALGLCTNKPRAPTRALLRGMRLGPFAAIVCGDDLPVRKPDPAPLLKCCARLGVEPEHTLYVGDSEIDHATAASAGVPFVLREGGYLNSPLRRPEPRLRLKMLSQLCDGPTLEVPDA